MVCDVKVCDNENDELDNTQEIDCKTTKDLRDLA